MPKPPFPAVSGLWGKPTVINNVETLSTLPAIMRMGAVKYIEYGTERSKGTKTFALAGKVKHTGLIEVPLGTTLREIVFEIEDEVLQYQWFLILHFYQNCCMKQLKIKRLLLRLLLKMYFS